VNTSIIGAFSRITRLVSIDSVAEAIGEEVPVNPGMNEKAAREAFDAVLYGDGGSK
jgi:Pyruvate/2-oxoacid:ferredoxin oxidoreductase gamma subunit